ncbi:helix-turn-helix transcriptional regulator [Microbacterium sp. NPDC055910]|uniref:helix-turn-helix transcriptional regulator n=1 Tax=Microbacterium sp. NPDC055910 TaxID=3345659 RepID=UPI0035DAC95F
MSRTSYSAISSYSRVEILHLLQEQPGRTIQDLCDRTGLHANTVREHIQRLIDAGHVVQEREHRTTRGRPRMLYSAATGEPDASSPVARKKVQDAARRGDLMRRVIPESAGPLEGEALHQLDAIVDDLVDAGFDPVVDQEALTIDLTPCPHATAQGEHLETLCRVHVGLMRSVLSEAGGPLRVEAVEDGCDPATCVVLLSR